MATVNGTPYTFDANGNLLNDGTTNYTYDAANRLTSVVGGGNTSAYAYNGLGDRLRQTVNSVTTNYTLDLNTGLTQVLADGNNSYLYGLGRIGELQPSGFAYHLGDALGSVRQLTDTSANVTLARNYEPFGNTLTSAGIGNSVFQFTGEQRDSATGLTYLRARYLNSYLNQWIQPDPIVPDWRNPQTLNRYTFVNNNPVNSTDPSGLCPDCYVVFFPGAGNEGDVDQNGSVRDNVSRDEQKFLDELERLANVTVLVVYPYGAGLRTNGNTDNIQVVLLSFA